MKEAAMLKYPNSPEDHVVLINFFGKWLLAIENPKLCKIVLSNSEVFYKYAYAGLQEGTLSGDLMGANILSESGPNWKRHRKIFNPVFVKNWDTMTFGLKTKQLLNQWDSLIENKKSINVTEWMPRITLDIFGLEVLGIDLNAIKENTDMYIKYQRMMELFNDFILLHLPFVYKHFNFLSRVKNAKEAINDFNKIIYDIIEDKKSRKEKVADGDLLDRFIMASESEVGGLSIKELRDSVLITLIAGHDTTSTSLICTLYNLAKYPDVQDKARREIELVMKSNDKRAIPSYDEQKEFYYLSAILKETMRLYPSLSSLPLRIATKDFKLGNIDLPKGTLVTISVMAMHHNKSHYENPDQFIPERFYDEEQNKLKCPMENLNDYKWLPFSGGGRSCIGMQFAIIEQRILTAMILRNYRIELSDELKQSEIPFAKNPILHPLDVNLRFIKI
ncbi:Cytochrome P450 domain-containing protein [Rozella allomycis CSF55]|uniref:Cytochrome P450 domain-containing protein n=1 Tax=Rozella allomycis (strain CSF55) TaxID=988480 RepID=A0A075B512_ROZAC|nr:Cytochrome P450 domain-containing protein [Rozella allomycis CSF55]|eukprot:EPZ36831.1 Cytochrome P450 domain-containing protein [Rozella allomycis CSF55]